jgi:hypothetical protein
LKERREMDYGDLSHEARELVLHIENTEPLYRQERYMYEALNKKERKGKFDREKAVKMFEYLATRAAKDYAKDNLSPGEWNRVFTTASRREAARFMRDAYVAEHPPKHTETRGSR